MLIVVNKAPLRPGSGALQCEWVWRNNTCRMVVAQERWLFWCLCFQCFVCSVFGAMMLVCAERMWVKGARCDRVAGLGGISNAGLRLSVLSVGMCFGMTCSHFTLAGVAPLYHTLLYRTATISSPLPATVLEAPFFFCLQGSGSRTFHRPPDGSSAWHPHVQTAAAVADIMQTFCTALNDLTWWHVPDSVWSVVWCLLGGAPCCWLVVLLPGEYLVQHW